MGWTIAAIEGTTDEEPAALYTAVKDFPAVTADVTYYAVFAKATEEAGAAAATYTFSADSQEGWTNTANKTNTYWLLDSGKELTSPDVDLSGLSSIQVRMRTYGGTQYDQLQVAAGATVITTIEASKGSTMTDYEWTNTKSLSGTSPLTFTCSNAASNKGIGLESVTINAVGAGTAYSRYITSCQGTTELVNRAVTGQPARKVLIGGQIYILIGEQLYTPMGQRIR